jgi:hypothetical protein
MAMGSGQHVCHGRGLMHSSGMVCVLAASVLPAAGCDLIYLKGQSRSPGRSGHAGCLLLYDLSERVDWRRGGLLILQ